MPLMEHLTELRTRLLISVGTVGAIALLAFWPSQFVIGWMEDAYFQGIQLHAFGPADVIATEIKFSLLAGVIAGLPVLFYQAWMFIVPAVHPRTRRIVHAFLAPSLLLAILGLVFAHFVVIPRIVRALVGITNAIATPTFGIGDTLNFVLVLLGLFALIFQLPILLVGLARLGVVTQAWLAQHRRHALFAFFAVGGIAAPDGSPLTMALLALPMYVLYEASIWVVLLLERSWNQQWRTEGGQS